MKNRVSSVSDRFVVKALNIQFLENLKTCESKCSGRFCKNFYIWNFFLNIRKVFFTFDVSLLQGFHSLSSTRFMRQNSQRS